MPEFLHMVAMLREQMQAELTRSDVLRVLIWPILILVLAIIAAVTAHAPPWVLIGIGAFTALFLLIYAGAFVAMLVYDRDALRTEKYNLQKMAMERGLYGDSTIGLHKIDDLPNENKLLEATPVDG